MELVKDVAAIVGGATEKLRKVKLFETPRFFLDVYVVAPGQVQTPHVHEGSDKVYVVLSGQGSVRVGEDVHAVREGHAVFCPAGQPHGVEGTGPGDLRLLVVMAPHPKPPKGPISIFP
jgi:mannose-6-phosphate isomerase-like protein (cupin superfamily)